MHARRDDHIRHAYRAERDAALLYEGLAAVEPDSRRRAALLQLALEENAHAAHWANELRAHGETLPEIGLSHFSRALHWLGARFGNRTLAPILVRRERREAARYREHLADETLSAQEQRHARVFRALARGEPDPLAASMELDRRGYNLRAAIFGINDGLVSSLSLTAALSGAQTETNTLILAGVAGLLAGAFSMAGGEFISVRTQRELMEREAALRRMELAASPDETRRGLAETYRSLGLDAADADRVASVLAQAPSLGPLPALGLLPPSDSLGSPFGAGLSSFTAFAGGALVPVLPYMLFPEVGLLLSVSATACALAGIGALLALLSGRNRVRSAIRMLTVGGSAATITYVIGRLFGVQMGG